MKKRPEHVYRCMEKLRMEYFLIFRDGTPLRVCSSIREAKAHADFLHRKYGTCDMRLMVHAFSPAVFVEDLYPTDVPF